jgi:hypothetical protein
MQRTGSDDQLPSLGERVFLDAFNQIPLKQRRAMVPGLLECAKVFHGTFLPENTPTFVRWLTSGKIQQFTDAQIEEAMILFEFIYQRGLAGLEEEACEEPLVDLLVFCDFTEFDNHIEGEFTIGSKQCSRYKFFEEILHRSPDRMHIGYGHGGSTMSIIHAITRSAPYFMRNADHITKDIYEIFDKHIQYVRTVCRDKSPLMIYKKLIFLP